MVTQEQAAEIERKTRYQSKSISWYEERQCTIMVFFGRVCRRLSSTSPDSFVNSIESGYAAIDDLVLCLGKGQ